MCEPHKEWLLNRYVSTIFVCIVLKSALVAEMANKEIRQRFKCSTWVINPHRVANVDGEGAARVQTLP